MTCGDSGGKAASGAPCGVSFGLGPDGRCAFHSADPAKKAHVAALRVAGGRAAGKLRKKAVTLPADAPKAPKSIEDAAVFASWLAHAVIVGKIEPRAAHEASVCLATFRGAREKADLARELAEVRAEIKALRGERRAP